VLEELRDAEGDKKKNKDENNNYNRFATSTIQNFSKKVRSYEPIKVNK
jgi:hypothetical protein